MSLSGAKIPSCLQIGIYPGAHRVLAPHTPAERDESPGVEIH
jgi:hypothetical protein